MHGDLERMADAAYREIEEMFVTGRLQPGGMVSEAYLGNHLKLGRAPIRDAIKRFEADGLLTPLHRKGILVARMDAWQQLHLLEVREPLELLIATTAAVRANEEERRGLLSCAKMFRQAVREKRNDLVLQADYDYKRIAVEATRNIFLARTIRPIHILSRRFWNIHVTFETNPQAMAESCTHHSLISTVIANADDAGADGAVRDFISFVKNFARTVLDNQFKSVT